MPESSSGRPFLDIPRLPGESLLEGVPHLRKESIFAEPGVVEALDLVNATHDLNSRQRRPIVDGQLATFVRHKIPLEIVSEGLTTVQGALQNPDKSRHAAYLGSVVAERRSRIAEASERQAAKSKRPEGLPANYVPGFLRFDKAARDRITAIDASTYDGGVRMDKDIVLRRIVSGLVKLDDAESPDIIEAGKSLYYRFVNPQADDTDKVATFIQLAYAIDKAKKDATSFAATTEVSNQIIAAAGTTLGLELPATYDTQQLLAKFETASADLDPTQWILPKLRNVSQTITHRIHLDYYLSRFNIRIRGTQVNFERLLAPREAELRELADATMDKLKALRSYGIKSAYFADSGVTKRDQESWVIMDPDELNEPDTRILQPHIAAFYLANTRRPENLEVEITRTQLAANTAHTQLSFNFFRNLSLRMFSDGELALDAHLNAIPLRQEFADRGLSGYYEYLRLSLIRHLYDLIVPANVVRQMPTEGKGPGLLKRIMGAAKQFSSIEELVLPRQRYLTEHFDEVASSLEAELNENEKQSCELPEHPVAAHKRSLPPGYYASPTAIALARKHGVTLADNETYVWKYNRGNPELGRITSHQAVSKKR